MNVHNPDPILRWIKHINKALRSSNMKVDAYEVAYMVSCKVLTFAESRDRSAFIIVQPTLIGENKVQLHVYTMGGSRKGMLELEHGLCEYGRSIGALKITANARKGFAAKDGWWRKNTEGWKNPCDFIEKEL